MVFWIVSSWGWWHTWPPCCRLRWRNKGTFLDLDIWTDFIWWSCWASNGWWFDILFLLLIKLILLIAPFPSSMCSMVPHLSMHYEVDWRNYVSSGGNASGVLILIMVWKLVAKPYRCGWHEAIWSILIGRNCSICGMTGTLEGITAGYISGTLDRCCSMGYRSESLWWWCNDAEDDNDDND